MKKYELTYQQPYEYDDDSPSGVGDHGVEYQRPREPFEARSDEDARQIVREFLSQGGLQFGFHFGSPPAGLYPRKFVSLYEVVDPREVIMEE